MNYYQELTLIPDAEISPYFIWQKLYTQLHIALADVKNNHGIDSIGVSFPNYRYENKNGKEFATLGNKLRVFGSESDLNTLDLPKWLSKLTDYVHLKAIAEVGDKASEYLVVRRYRYKNLTRQARSFAAHKNIAYDVALEHCRQYKTGSRENYPFINLASADTGQFFKLGIRQETVNTQMQGSFTTYGLSHVDHLVTVPNW